MESRRGFISINMKQQLMQGDGHASVFICQHLATFLYRQNQHSQLELDWDQYREEEEAERDENDSSFDFQKHHDLSLKQLSYVLAGLHL